MWLDGTAIDLAATYSVTVNSFLATGGDNFTALNGARASRTPGKTDLQAQVDYFAEFANAGAGDQPLPGPLEAERRRRRLPGRRPESVRSR